MRAWLGKTVGKEAEDLSRHDKWLCMMYPRLALLKQFLREDGAIFVSIDDNEVAALRLLMDEVFGVQNFVATVLWQKKYAVANDHKTIAPMHDFVLVYQQSPKWRRNLLPRGDDKDGQTSTKTKKVCSVTVITLVTKRRKNALTFITPSPTQTRGKKSGRNVHGFGPTHQKNTPAM